MREWGEVYAVAAVFAVLIAATVWYEIRHPCVRRREYECETTSCSFYDVDGNCQLWTTEMSTCTECLERL